MANRFQVNTLILGGQTITTTGNTICVNGVAILQSGQFYPSGSNLSGFITTGQTGQFYPTSNPNLFVTSGNLSLSGSTISLNLNITGSNLYSYITGLSGNLNLTGINLQSQINTIQGSFVLITGQQNISGIKIFDNSVFFYDVASNTNILEFTTGITGTIIIRSFDGNISTDFRNRILYKNVGIAVLGWQSNLLYDNTAINSIDWNNRLLIDNNGNISIDWQNRVLSGNWNIPSSNISSGVSSVDNLTGTLNLTGIGNNSTFISGQTIIISGYINPYVSTGILYDTTITPSINWMSRILMDNNNCLAEDWQNRLFYDSGGNITLDWQNKILSGNWNVSGIAGITNTGFLSGYYPVSNPNQFINSGQGTLFDSVIRPSVLWYSRVLVDNNAAYSIDWNNRKLQD